MNARKKYEPPACLDLELPSAEGLNAGPLSICRNGATAGSEPLYCSPGSGALLSCRTGAGRGNDCASGGHVDAG